MTVLTANQTVRWLDIIHALMTHLARAALGLGSRLFLENRLMIAQEHGLHSFIQVFRQLDRFYSVLIVF